jgi:hypothetical protein
MTSLGILQIVHVILLSNLVVSNLVAVSRATCTEAGERDWEIASWLGM